MFIILIISFCWCFLVHSECYFLHTQIDLDSHRSARRKFSLQIVGAFWDLIGIALILSKYPLKLLSSFNLFLLLNF